ncbi:MAG: D-glycero-alpha-D-manno-heptose-1,7-bisphosphate 7-phosphatase [Acidimicrobiia bacterium]
MKTPAVFLDRDGVLIETPRTDGRPVAVHRAEDMVVLPGVADALGELRRAGLKLVCVTNQPDIARGLVSAEVVEHANAVLCERLGLDAVRCCPHDDPDPVGCRKPAPGLILGAAIDLELDLRRSVMVGDRWRDIEAGRRAGCLTVFIDRDYDERPPEAPDAVVRDLAESVPWIVAEVNAPTSMESGGSQCES